ncbi:unnamed protein product, partial [Iphiclides podalirius]
MYSVKKWEATAARASRQRFGKLGTSRSSARGESSHERSTPPGLGAPPPAPAARVRSPRDKCALLFRWGRGRAEGPSGAAQSRAGRRSVSTLARA